MSKSLGDRGEAAVVEFLKAQGFGILSTNWRSRWCEIDIVAKKDNVVHFVEVKYRGRIEQGEGLDYITHSKLKQMSFAAEFWMSSNKYEGDAVLSAASVNSDLQIQFLENIS